MPRVLTGSDVFNDLISNASGDGEITFLDPEVEHSTIVSAWLHLFLNGKLVLGPPSAIKLRTVIHLVDFLEKWSCGIARNTFKLLLETERPIAYLHHFVVGAVMADRDVCADALFSELKNVISSNSRKSSSNISNRPVFDLATVDFDSYKRIPLHYQWAAARILPSKFSSLTQKFEVRSKFADYLQQAERPHDPRPSSKAPAKRRRRLAPGDS
jgi:hypothetical protein